MDNGKTRRTLYAHLPRGPSINICAVVLGTSVGVSLSRCLLMDNFLEHGVKFNGLTFLFLIPYQNTH